MGIWYLVIPQKEKYFLSFSTEGVFYSKKRLQFLDSRMEKALKINTPILLFLVSQYLVRLGCNLPL